MADMKIDMAPHVRAVRIVVSMPPAWKLRTWVAAGLIKVAALICPMTVEVIAPGGEEPNPLN